MREYNELKHQQRERILVVERCMDLFSKEVERRAHISNFCKLCTFIISCLLILILVYLLKLVRMNWERIESFNPWLILIVGSVIGVALIFRRRRIVIQ